MPEGDDLDEGILRGLYRYAPATPPSEDTPRAQVLASGVAMPWALNAQRLLAEDWGVAADVWSATSWTELRRDALAVRGAQPAQAGRRAPGAVRDVGAVRRARPGRRGVRLDARGARPDRPLGAGRLYTSLGTDGFGFSDTRGRRAPVLPRGRGVDRAGGAVPSWPRRARCTARCRPGHRQVQAGPPGLGGPRLGGPSTRLSGPPGGHGQPGRAAGMSGAGPLPGRPQGRVRPAPSVTVRPARGTWHAGQMQGKRQATGGTARRVPAANRVHPETVARIERSLGTLGTAAIGAMDERLPWFPGDDRRAPVVARAGRAGRASPRSWTGSSTRSGRRPAGHRGVRHRARASWPGR